MNALKRIILFLVCFVVIASVAFFILGVFAGTAAIRDAGNTASATEIARSAARDAGNRYSLLIWLGSLVLSAGIAFRWIGAIIAVAIAALVSFSGGRVTPSEEPVTQSVPTPSTVLPRSNGADTAQQRATRLYPELGIRNSPLNQEFVRRHGKYRLENKHYFDNPEWPSALAKECKDALIQK